MSQWQSVFDVIFRFMFVKFSSIIALNEMWNGSNFKTKQKQNSCFQISLIKISQDFVLLERKYKTI